MQNKELPPSSEELAPVLCPTTAAEENKEMHPRHSFFYVDASTGTTFGDNLAEAYPFDRHLRRQFGNKKEDEQAKELALIDPAIKSVTAASEVLIDLSPAPPISHVTTPPLEGEMSLNNTLQAFEDSKSRVRNQDNLTHTYQESHIDIAYDSPLLSIASTPKAQQKSFQELGRLYDLADFPKAWVPDFSPDARVDKEEENKEYKAGKIGDSASTSALNDVAVDATGSTEEKVLQPGISRPLPTIPPKSSLRSKYSTRSSSSSRAGSKDSAASQRSETGEVAVREGESNDDAKDRSLSAFATNVLDEVVASVSAAEGNCPGKTRWNRPRGLKGREFKRICTDCFDIELPIDIQKAYEMGITKVAVIDGILREVLHAPYVLRSGRCPDVEGRRSPGNKWQGLDQTPITPPYWNEGMERASEARKAKEKELEKERMSEWQMVDGSEIERKGGLIDEEML